MSKQSESQGSEGSLSGTISPWNSGTELSTSREVCEGSLSGTISPWNSGTELSTSREVSFAADLSSAVNDADDDKFSSSTESRHRALSWNTSHRAARKRNDTYDRTNYFTCTFSIIRFLTTVRT